MNKKIIVSIITVLSMLVSIVSFMNNAEAKENVLSTKNVKMAVGKTYTLKISKKTKGASINYKVNKGSDVASVSQVGKIKAKKKGIAYVMVTVKKGEKIIQKTKCKITVINGAKTVKIDQGDIRLSVGETKQMTGTMTKKNHGDCITWSSSDNKVAQISLKGKVTGKKEGKSSITAKTISGKKATVKVTVIDEKEPITTPPNVTVSPSVTESTVETASPSTTEPTNVSASPSVTEPASVTASPSVTEPTSATASPSVTEPTSITESPSVSPSSSVSPVSIVDITVQDSEDEQSIIVGTYIVVETLEGDLVLEMSADSENVTLELEYGKYHVIVEKDGYFSDSKFIEVKEEKTAIDFILDKLPNRATLTVNVKNDKGEQINGFSIIYIIDEDVVLNFISAAESEQGTVNKTLPNNEYQIAVHKQGYQVAMADVSLRGIDKTVDVVLYEEEDSVEYKVKMGVTAGEPSKPVTGAYIYVIDTNSQTMISMLSTNQDGNVFRTSGLPVEEDAITLPTGLYIFATGKTGYKQYDKAVIVNGKDQEILIKLTSKT